MVTEYVIDPSDAEVCRANGDEWFTGTLTRTETIPTRGTAATDTSVFPFGTKFKVPGYGYAIGRDTGNAVNGYHIDLVVRSCAEAIKWGVHRNVPVQYELPLR